ncbi:MAG: hypothetical protein HQ483_15505 [Rhodospirillales bacterium]|nr:hypothetical protein [Rhodospirillales bacterium]
MRSLKVSIRRFLLASLVMPLFVISGPVLADTPDVKPPLLIRTQGVQETGILQMASVRPAQQPAPLLGETRADKLQNLQLQETLVVGGTALVAATLGLATGGATYAVTAGGAVVLLYLLLP